MNKSKSEQALSRRDFLKLAAVAPAALLLNADGPRPQPEGAAPNVIVIVYDAWSADDTSLYGYPRKTTPKLEAFAENALVYHHHFSGGTYTTPGSASILTGLYPWTHRALTPSGPMLQEHVGHNIFSLFSDSHARAGYAQNLWADLFLYQMEASLSRHVNPRAFNLNTETFYEPYTQKDPYAAYIAFEDLIFEKHGGVDASLFLGEVGREIVRGETRQINEQYKDRYPGGLPLIHYDPWNPFLFESLVDGAIDLLGSLPSPFVVYLHFYPPHAPYRTPKQFAGSFAGGWRPNPKPIHPASEQKTSPRKERGIRQAYDEFIAAWDAETGRLYDYLRSSGLMDNSYVFITSDHGELNERGENTHTTRMMFDPLMHVPLVVSTPGQKTRQDIYDFTSCVDLLPTLAHVFDKPAPPWAEGRVLPGLGGATDPERSIYVVEGSSSGMLSPLNQATVALIKDHQRLIYYNYPTDRHFEFYDTAEDPEELTDLFPAAPAAAGRLREELLAQLAVVDRPYLHPKGG